MIPKTLKQLRKALPAWDIYSGGLQLTCAHKIEWETWHFDIWYGQYSRSDKRRAILAAYRAAQAFERGK